MRFIALLLFLLIPTFTTHAASPRLLFDQGHRQAFLIENEGPLQLNQLAETMRGEGWQVESTHHPLTRETLSGVSALIISGPFAPLTTEEITNILNFVQQGGRVAIMIHINQTLLPLLHKLGVDAGNMVIHEEENRIGNKSIDFFVKNFKHHPLTRNLKQFAIYGGWPLQAFTASGQVLASSGPHSWADLNRDSHLGQQDLVQPFDVLISGSLGQGAYAVFADDAIFQNQFLTGGNLQLAENLARWLLGESSAVEI